MPLGTPEHSLAKEADSLNWLTQSEASRMTRRSTN
jgi:hypothetical protein